MLETNELKQRIQELTSSSEDLFLAFARSFPPVEKEMRRSLELSSRSLGDLSDSLNLNYSLRGVFDVSHKRVEEAAKHFRSMHARDDALLASLNRGIETLSGLDHNIALIKDDSIEMELISLNAMTVALKSGVAGKAFSVITDELQRLSSRTIQLTDQLTDIGQSMLEQFRAFRKEVEALEASERSLFDGLEERIGQRFAALERVIIEMSTGFSSLVEASRGVTKPVSLIMETVQIQDILHQSLDHVLLALTEIDSVSSEDPLDDLAFRKNLSELAANILDDVADRLEKASTTIRNNVEAVKAVMNDGEHRRQALMDQYCKEDSKHSAGASFTIAMESLDEIAGQVASYIKKKQGIARNGERLSSTVEALESRFRAFIKIISRFKTIDIASRIEVAKQSSLQGMNDTVSEMSRLTERIAEDVQTALDATSGFIEDSKSAILEYNAMADEEAGLTNRVQNGFLETRETLSRMRHSIIEGTRGFTLFTKEFSGGIAGAGTDIQKMDELYRYTTAVREELRTFRDESDRRLAEAGRDSSQDHIHSERLRGIIQRFTIFAHKRAAGSIAGFEVEEGSETGEVVFF